MNRNNAQNKSDGALIINPVNSKQDDRKLLENDKIPYDADYESDEENSWGFSLFDQNYLRSILSSPLFSAYSDQTRTSEKSKK